ncbi:hypothetical protein B0H14DRAFT_3515936, partial [Mycena olivaceomarginata]
TLGVFVSGAGDPVRGTLEWPAHPRAHREQAIVQVLPAPLDDAEPRVALVAALSGYLVPSTQKSEKMRKVPVGLLRQPQVA